MCKKLNEELSSLLHDLYSAKISAVQHMENHHDSYTSMVRLYESLEEVHRRLKYIEDKQENNLHSFPSDSLCSFLFFIQEVRINLHRIANEFSFAQRLLTSKEEKADILTALTILRNLDDVLKAFAKDVSKDIVWTENWIKTL